MRFKRVISSAVSVSMVAAALFYTAPVMDGEFTGAIKAKAATEYKVEDFGAKAGDGKSDTDAINSAIDAARDTDGGVIVFGSGKYNIGVFDFWGSAVAVNVTVPNITFKLDKKTVLEVMPTSYDEFNAIDVKADNFTITGGKLSGNRKKHKGKSGECGHGIAVRDCKNVTIKNMTICDNWGDGIYLGSMRQTDKLYGCNKVKIVNCTISNNRRNNIAIVDADNVTIDKCKILKASGVQPSCGINIEPNTYNGKFIGNEVCKNITIKNTKVTCKKMGLDNWYFAFQTIYHPENRKLVSCKNVKIENCDFGGDAGNYSGKNVTIKKSKIKGTFYDGVGTKYDKKTKIGSYYRIP